MSRKALEVERLNMLSVEARRWQDPGSLMTSFSHWATLGITLYLSC